MRNPPDVTISTGSKDSPLCLFVHGTGMDLSFWVNPQKTRILAGRVPLPAILSSEPSSVDKGHDYRGSVITGIPQDDLKTSFHDLKDEGFTVMAYSQRRPMADHRTLIYELEWMLNKYRDLLGNGVIFIAHSRGGLIARKVMESLRIRCEALITVGTPHHGSSMARLAELLSRGSRLIYPFFEDAERGTVSGTIKRVMDFLGSEAVRELLPGSSFISGLDDRRLESVRVLSFGGTDPTLFTLYRWKERTASYRKMFSFPDILTKLLPESVLPDELVNGKGDGNVSAWSSVAPYADEHYNLPLNHLRLIFDQRVRKRIVRFVKHTSQRSGLANLRKS